MITGKWYGSTIIINQLEVLLHLSKVRNKFQQDKLVMPVLYPQLLAGVKINCNEPLTTSTRLRKTFSKKLSRKTKYFKISSDLIYFFSLPWSLFYTKIQNAQHLSKFYENWPLMSKCKWSNKLKLKVSFFSQDLCQVWSIKCHFSQRIFSRSAARPIMRELIKLSWLSQ